MKEKFITIFLAMLVLAGCQSRTIGLSDVDWPVEAVTSAINSSNIQVAGNVNSDIKPDEIEVEKPVNSELIKVELPKDINSDDKPPAAPKFFDLKVLFASQAPFANWDELHNEACEEASMIMADVYFNNKPLSAHLMEQGILDLVKWETKNGYSLDVTAAEVVDILMNYFNLQGELITEVNPEKIKSFLDEGKLIIVPAAGRLLENPYYKSPGPLYHMLVIRGYDDDSGEFITNDPGTKRGEGYRYPYQILINAIHDWPKKGMTRDDVSEAEMNAGRPVIIVIKGNPQ